MDRGRVTYKLCREWNGVYIDPGYSTIRRYIACSEVPFVEEAYRLLNDLGFIITTIFVLNPKILFWITFRVLNKSPQKQGIQGGWIYNLTQESIVTVFMSADMRNEILLVSQKEADLEMTDHTDIPAHVLNTWQSTLERHQGDIDTTGRYLASIGVVRL